MLRWCDEINIQSRLNHNINISFHDQRLLNTTDDERSATQLQEGKMPLSGSDLLQLSQSMNALDTRCSKPGLSQGAAFKFF